MLLTDVYKMYGEVFPTSASALAAAIAGATPADVTGLSIVTFPNNVRLTWAAAANAVQYEIRLGATWATSTYVLTTSQLVANVDPIVLDLTTGNYTFLIKAIGSSGLYSDNADSEVLNVPTIPGPSLTGTGIANNALLSWTDPASTWEIAYFIIKRDGTEIGYIDGNFMISSELIGGTYDYTVLAVDIVGNVGAESAAATLILDDPIDLIFVDAIDAALTGTFSDTALASYNGLSGVIGAIITETYQEHFVDNSWADPQAQVTAGYDIWLSPTGTTGYYEEIFDFGVVITDSTIIAYYTHLALFGTVTVTTDISFSDDNISYSTPVTGTAVLADSFRYVKIRWNFSNTDNESLAFLHGLRCSVSTQLVLDSGTGFADSADTTGTTITINKTYTQINSITLTSNSVQPIILIYDNVTTNSFDVYAFDTSGNRVDCDFGWKVRGII
jgi:hypothetical protein